MQEFAISHVENDKNIVRNVSSLTDVLLTTGSVLGVGASKKIDSEIKKSIVDSMKFEAKAGIIDYQDSEYKNIELPLREFINKYEIESAYQLLEDSFNKLTIRDYLFNLHTLFLAT